MKDSRLRLVSLGVVYLAVAASILAFLGYVMFGQAELWEQRSLGNRWAFRDVPTRRGAILDAQGVLLRQDAPTSAFELLYRRFRRHHPAGVALHGANLWRQHRGAAPLRADPAGFRQALLDCLQIPAAALRSSQTGDSELARDMRYYLGALLGALHRGGAAAWHRALLQLARGERQGAVFALLGVEQLAAGRVYAARLQDLHSFHEALILGDTAEPPRRDLWRVLERLRVATALHARIEAAPATERDGLRAMARSVGMPDPHPETVPYPLHRRLPYPQARRIAQLEELHPGLLVRAAVDREEAEVDASVSWSCLRSLLGAMRRHSPRDARLREAQVRRMRDTLQDVALADPDLSETHRQQVTWRLEDSLFRHLESEGRVGEGGVEEAMDAVLRGTAGVQWIERRRGAQEVGYWDGFDVTPGADVRLSVDLRLQDIVERALQHGPGWDPARASEGVAAVVLIEPRSGNILALASTPGPEARKLLAEAEEDGELRADPLLRWWSAGDIGSLAKPLVLLEHLSARRQGRAFAAHEEFCRCPGSLSKAAVAGSDYEPETKAMRARDLTCSHVHNEAVRDPVASLADSCNYFFYQASRGLGRAGLLRAYRRFGLRVAPARLAGQTAAEVYAARVGTPVRGLPAWSRTGPRSRNRGLERGGIGYGIYANVLDVARVYAGLATTRLPELALVQRGADAAAVDLLADTALADWQTVWQGLRGAVEHGSAAAELRGLDPSLGMVFAKTGTAVVGNDKEFNNAWLAGFVGAPPDGARLVFACVVYKSRLSGARAAGPIVRNLLNAIAARPELRGYLQ